MPNHLQDYPSDDDDYRKFKRKIAEITPAWSLFTTKHRKMYKELKLLKQSEMGEFVIDLDNGVHHYNDGSSFFYIIKEGNEYILVLQNTVVNRHGITHIFKIDTSFGYKYRFCFRPNVRYSSNIFLPFRELTSSFSRDTELNGKILVLLDLIKGCQSIDNSGPYNPFIIKNINSLINQYLNFEYENSENRYISEYEKNRNRKSYIDIFYIEFIKIRSSSLNSVRPLIILDEVNLKDRSVAKENIQSYNGVDYDNIQENDEDPRRELQTDQDLQTVRPDLPTDSENLYNEDLRPASFTSNSENLNDEYASATRRIKPTLRRRRTFFTPLGGKHKTNKRRMHKTNRRRKHKTNKHHRRW